MQQKSCLDCRGSTAIEFALIAVPFFGILVALFEIGLVFLSQTSFERRVDEMARQVKVGQAQSNNLQRQDIREFICDGLIVGSGCQTQLLLEIETLTSADASSGRSAIAIDNSRAINLGAAGELVLLRASLPYEAMISVGDYSPISSASGEPFRFSAATMVRNEPF